MTNEKKIEGIKENLKRELRQGFLRNYYHSNNSTWHEAVEDLEWLIDKYETAKREAYDKGFQEGSAKTAKEVLDEIKSLAEYNYNNLFGSWGEAYANAVDTISKKYNVQNSEEK